MLALILAVFFSLLISAICSTTETVLYSVPWAHIEKMRRQGKASGDLLFEIRSNIEKPIAAVLTLNTIANTAGAAIAGAAFVAVFDSGYMAAFAAGFTVLVLFFGEIIPKTLGVAHCETLSGVVARPLHFMVRLLSPLLWLSSLVTRAIAPPSGGPQISEDDIRVMASLSRQIGAIKPTEERLIRNILALNEKRVRDIMTPRTVVFSLPADMTAAQAHNAPDFWKFSRVPIYADNNEDLVGIVTRQKLIRRILAGHNEMTLGELMAPINFVLENQSADELLQEFLGTRIHLFAVLDEYGGLAGVVSLEDVLEEMLGREIVDESDSVADLREMARQKRKALINQGDT